MKERIFSRNALQTAFRNAYKRWIPAVEAEKGDPNSAMARLSETEAFTPVHVDPKFSLSRGDKIMTIGSCFARNVEKALVASGMEVPTMGFDFDKDLLLPHLGAMADLPSPRSLLNKYSTQAIDSEISRVLEGQTPPDRGFLRLEEDGWLDPQLAAVLRPLPFETLGALRDRVEALVGEVRDARAVFITLGLTETWRDTQTGLFLNSSPPPRLMRSDRDRFEFFSSSFEQTYGAIKHALETIRAHSTVEKNFVLTVSPVPMATTWTARDVISANTYSKSLLRVTAQTLAEECDDVDYFPSYEIVMNSPRHMAWLGDQLHVTQAMVDFAIGLFMESYVR